MFSCFYPDEYLDCAYEIDFEAFYRRGIRGVIFDIDNTLVPHMRRRTRVLLRCLRGCAGRAAGPCFYPIIKSPA